MAKSCKRVLVADWYARLRLPLRSWSDLDRLSGSLSDWERSPAFHAGRHRPSLGGMRKLCRLLGDPLRGIPVIHVAGSKGKGSVCLVLQSLAEAHGLSTGVYLSPHVEQWNERVQLHGRPCRGADLRAWIGRVLFAARELPEPPTFFETLTAAALLAFRDAAVDLAIVEVGLGGRLDCTNVVRPKASVITTIECEHQAILGRTLCDIAREKAGILKPGVPVVSGLGRLHPASGVIAERALSLRAPLRQWGVDFRARRREERMLIQRAGRPSWLLPIPPIGPFALLNTALAVLALEEAVARCRSLPRSLDPERMSQALSRLHIPGRCERIGAEPALYRDGAHTPLSVAAACRWVAARHAGRKPVLVLGLMRDKRAHAILRAVKPVIGPLVATEVPGDRSLEADLLAAWASERGLRAHARRGWPDALGLARRLAGRHGSILVTGSFWLAGCVRPERRSAREAVS